MYISKTPLRVSFFGGGTDYPEYFQNNPSAVLGGTIDKYIYTTATDLAPFAMQKYRVSYRVVEDCDTIDEISHPVIREVLREHKYDVPTGFYTVSDLPGGTGLGSSSSFTVGFINLINQLKHNDAVSNAETLAIDAIRLERDILNENVGVQDQTHAAYGGLARYDFAMNNDQIDIARQPLELSASRAATLNSCMILVYTDIVRHASNILSEQIEHTKQGSNASYLSTMYDMAAEGKSILERDSDDMEVMKELGNLLNQGWSLKKNLSNGVTNTTVDDIYNTGMDMGAYGGKLLGAGGGGFVMFLLDPALIPEFKNEFGSNNVISINFTDSKSHIIKV